MASSRFTAPPQRSQRRRIRHTQAMVSSHPLADELTQGEPFENPPELSIPASVPASTKGRTSSPNVLRPRRVKGALAGGALLWQLRKPPRVHLAAICLMGLGLLLASSLAMAPWSVPGWFGLSGGEAVRYQPLLPLVVLLATTLGRRVACVGLGLWLVAAVLGVPLLAGGGGPGVVHSPGFAYWLALLPVAWAVATTVGWLFAKVTHAAKWMGLCVALGVLSTLLWHGLSMTGVGVLAVAEGWSWPVLASWWTGLSAGPLPYDCLLSAVAVSLTRVVRAALWPLLY
jgi:biotin transporter BioY